MVIDFHTHAFADNIFESAIGALAERSGLTPAYSGSAGGLREKMRESGVDLSVVLPIATKPSQTEKINAWAASENRDGLMAFGTVHPENSDFGTIIRNVKAAGLKGIKMHPDYQGFFAGDESVFPIYNEIFENQLILVLHCGVDIGLPPPTHCPPKELVKLLRAFPKARLVISHLGGHKMWDEFVREMRPVVEDGLTENVCIDTSMGTGYYSEKQFRNVYELFGREKLLFATDGPWTDAASEISELKRLIAAADPDHAEEACDMIFFKNAKNLLGL